MPVWTVANGFDLAVIEPRQEKQNDDRTTHHHHAPELRVKHQHGRYGHQGHCRDSDLEQHRHTGFENGEGGSSDDTSDKDIHHLAGHGAQHRVVRREVPDRRNVRWRLERISRDEVVVFEEVSAGFRGEENNRCEDH